MKVECKFDGRDHIVKFNNVLTISNGHIINEVVVRILTVSGEVEAETAVDGNELIKAIQNAMNV